MILVIVMAVGLLTMRNFGRRLITRLPFPHRVRELYDRFEEGVFGALGLRSLPLLLVITGLIWATEAMRLFLVVEAMGFPDVHLGISGAFFVALTASLLTAVPLTPAGIGFVEGARRRPADDRLQRAPDRGPRDRARRPGDQRAVGHPLRFDRVRGLTEATWRGAGAARPPGGA